MPVTGRHGNVHAGRQRRDDDRADSSGSDGAGSYLRYPRGRQDRWFRQGCHDHRVISKNLGFMGLSKLFRKSLLPIKL